MLDSGRSSTTMTGHAPAFLTGQFPSMASPHVERSPRGQQWPVSPSLHASLRRAPPFAQSAQYSSSPHCSWAWQGAHVGASASSLGPSTSMSSSSRSATSEQRQLVHEDGNDLLAPPSGPLEHPAPAQAEPKGHRHKPIAELSAESGQEPGCPSRSMLWPPSPWQVHSLQKAEKRSSLPPLQPLRPPSWHMVPAGQMQVTPVGDAFANLGHAPAPPPLLGSGQVMPGQPPPFACNGAPSPGNLPHRVLTQSSSLGEPRTSAIAPNFAESFSRAFT
mmetsp:Transcript_99553/g.277111  ORF Transcript_99553/g.277111 Transcript_99553/m.277111 type:complete len:275 (-) Transcript_99553:1391-2215(-)